MGMLAMFSKDVSLNQPQSLSTIVMMSRLATNRTTSAAKELKFGAQYPTEISADVSIGKR
jgi:hypothetical protein